jgi:hypothetical protein
VAAINERSPKRRAFHLVYRKILSQWNAFSARHGSIGSNWGYRNGGTALNLTRHGLPLIIALVGIGLPVLIGHTLGHSIEHSMPRQAHRPTNVAVSPANASPPEAQADIATPGSRSELWQTIRSDMFSHEVPPSVIAPVVASPAATALPLPAAVTPANDPLADYVYNGTVMVDGEMSALIEHRKSRQGWYVSEGDTWQSYRILAIDAGQVTVEVNGETRTLTKSDDINVVPLASSAGQRAPTSAAESYLNAYQATLANPVQISLVSALGDAINQMDLSNIKISLDNAQIRLNQDSGSKLDKISFGYIATP